MNRGNSLYYINISCRLNFAAFSPLSIVFSWCSVCLDVRVPMHVLNGRLHIEQSFFAYDFIVPFNSTFSTFFDVLQFSWLS